MVRPLQELLETKEPAWPRVQAWIREAAHVVETLPPSDPARSEALLAVQVTTRSPMGAVVYEIGGLLVDHGWLRVLGSGHPRLPRSLPRWNQGRADPTSHLLVADDVIGGFFAINGGGLGDDVGDVYYFAPDTLRWEALELGYSQFLEWTLSDAFKNFYRDYRWHGWEREVAALAGERVYSIQPFPFLKGPLFSERNRRPIPIAEAYDLLVNHLAPQIRDLPRGAEIRIDIGQ